MSFRSAKFRQACLTWISRLSGEPIASTDDLVDARILIDITTEADPEHFATASLVLSSNAGEPNLDGLAQLARLLLRYFEQGTMGRQMLRECVPGVNSLATVPFDDLWRLVVLVVSVTLLSECNGASRLYDELDEDTRSKLRSGVDAVWGVEEERGVVVDLDLGISEMSRVSAGQMIGASRRGGPMEASTSNDTSHDSFTSVRTSFQPFQSAHSSVSDQRPLASESRLLISENQQQPALLRIASSVDRESIGSIASTDSGSNEPRGSLIGFRMPEDMDDAGSTASTDSYVSRFSQELAEFGPEATSIGLSGPDSAAAYVFLLNTVAYLALGVYLLATTVVPPTKSPAGRDYGDLLRGIAQVAAVSVASAIASLMWVQLLRQQTRKVVWLTTLGIPVVSTATALWATTQVFRIPGVEELVGYRVRSCLVVGTAMVLAVRFGWTISHQRVQIERSVGVISLACDVVLQNKALYGFSVLLLALYCVFAVVSAIFASRLPLLSLSLQWHAWGVPAYMAVSFAWISAVFVQFLRSVVSCVVSQWYFHRHDPGEPPVLHTLQAAAMAALTRQLGTVVLSASLLFAAKLIHLLELCLRWMVSLLRIVPLSLVSMLLGRPMRLADALGNYAVVYAGFSGKGFFESSRFVRTLLGKHDLLHSPVVSLVKSSMTCLALLLSVLTGYTLGVHAIGQKSTHSALVALAGSTMPFALLQLVTHVLSCTIESLVVCYAIDLELNTCHSVDVSDVMFILG
ncbi:hypothetical protein LPJ66_007223 [Kickxella alabastrina]|uniref:Uncharacterized protein n=1 Tax=Kickxella alabastrina TaxID=61397 RepID=A0ACC1I9I3_9FUNG|nr:hypothetical protein LPJ66_007223 [Kickxella alabastrina]